MISAKDLTVQFCVNLELQLLTNSDMTPSYLETIP